MHRFAGVDVWMCACMCAQARRCGGSASIHSLTMQGSTASRAGAEFAEIASWGPIASRKVAVVLHDVMMLACHSPGLTCTHKRVETDERRRGGRGICMALLPSSVCAIGQRWCGRRHVSYAIWCGRRHVSYAISHCTHLDTPAHAVTWELKAACTIGQQFDSAARSQVRTLSKHVAHYWTHRWCLTR